ncbi:osmolarity response regulator transcription factor OmpR [Derxia lacustris]|uniref:osmolarity response regulator transcription factor OmpR n=1 Tax=Derxia lacustris TaxID=764842 RepID=UPI000A16F3A8|nr:two-component system response regulator OmpR [Derxia lacustris]
MTDTAARLLVVDDEAELCAMLQRYLGSQGHEVRTAADASQMDRLLLRERFDLLVLDLMLPGEDGLAICRRLRAAGETLPILMLTARGDPVDRIVGLEMGADDYLPKPFNPRELLARVNAMLRRQAMSGRAPLAARAAVIRFGEYTLDPAARRLLRGELPVTLTSGEFALLHALASHAGRPLGRERLIELAYGPDHDAGERSIDVTMLRLRRLIEADPAAPRWLQTVRGYGYVFAPDGAPR